MKQRWIGIISGVVSLVLFVILTILVRTVDVQTVAATGSRIGLARLNQWFWQHFSGTGWWGHLSTWLGGLAVVVAAVLVGWLVGQWLVRKSWRRLDRRLIAAVGILILMAGLYLFFEIVIVNYRPLLVDGALKASYPSSHALLLGTVLPVGWAVLRSYLRLRPGRIAGDLLVPVLVVVGLVDRACCGVHWLTDIVAGGLLAAALNGLFYTLTAAGTQSAPVLIDQKND